MFYIHAGVSGIRMVVSWLIRMVVSWLMGPALGLARLPDRAGRSDIVGIDSRPVKKRTTRGWWWSAGLVDGFLRRRSASRYRVWRQRKNHPGNA